MMNDPIDKEFPPLICTFVQLRDALEPMHMNAPADVDNLHDIWRRGAPTPESGIFNPAVSYDERKVQPLNHVARIIPPSHLVKWITDVTARRGMPITPKQALNILSGKADYGDDPHV